MNFKIIWTLVLFACALWQMVLAWTAEGKGNFDQATYEMMWVFFFMYLMHREEQS